MTITPVLTRATEFTWLTARLLDRYRFQYLFVEGGDKNFERQAVLRALQAYQNTDGGFGNALEPDLRGPLSQPQPVELALRVLDDINAFDRSFIEPICNYLLTISTPEGGVPFVLPTALAYPHGPWWLTSDNPPASLNPTAALAGLLHKHHIQHPWLEQATAYCWRKLDGLKNVEEYEMRAIMLFLDYTPERDRARALCTRLGPMLIEQKLVQLDPDAEGHAFSPLDFAPYPESLARALFSNTVIEHHLDALQRRQQTDGGWPINWAAWAPTTEIEWRGWTTVEALKTLRAYGRLDHL